MPTQSSVAGCASCQTRCRTEWRRVSGIPLTRLDEARTSRMYGTGEAIYGQGEECGGIHCIKTGLVGIRRLNEHGHSTLIRLVYPGATFGYRSLLRKAPHENSAEALMPSEICFIDGKAVRRLLQNTPELYSLFLDHSLRDLSETEGKYMESVTRRAKTRLLNVMLMLYERFGHETERGAHLIDLPISRQDLAELIGAAPETMSRTIHRVQTEGLAKFDGRRVWISDIDALSRDLSRP